MTDAKMQTWEVTVPIAGHAYVTVQAATKAEAISLAIDETTLDSIQEWTALPRFHQGNVCYCPSPWEAEAVAEPPDEDDQP